MKYVPIRVSTLRGNLPITFDVYLLIAGKYLLFSRKGNSFEDHRLNRLKEKHIKKVFILKEHEASYGSYLSENLERAYDFKSSTSIEDSAAVVQGALQGAAEDLMENVETKEFYETAQIGTKRFVDFLSKNDSALKSLLNIEADPNDVARHCTNVAALSIGICEVLGLTNTQPNEVNQMALGCLIHDIEHYHSGIPLDLNAEQMTQENLAIYRNHPSAGIQRLVKTSHFEGLVVEIIKNHEELMDGSGYPAGLHGKEINPYVSIASLANVYDRKTTFKKVDPKTTLKEMLIHNMGQFPLEHLQALQRVLKTKKIL